MLYMDDTWAIDSDGTNFILKKKRTVKEGKNAGTEVWDNEAYGGDLRSITASLAKRATLDPRTCLNFATLKACADRIEQVVATINAIKPAQVANGAAA